MNHTEAIEHYATHRDTLFGVAYQMLGTVADAEDVLQETWLSWSSANRSAVTNPRAYLTRITVNHALARLQAPARRHESYPGPWLPEPLVRHPGAPEPEDAADVTVRADEVSLALMVVLETLSPLERAVFILRETFAYDYAEIGRMLNRSAAAVRQAGHRAREHVEARRPRFPADPDVRREVTQRFLAAAAGGDIESLLEMLDPDVEMWTDGGGRVRAALNVIRGRDKVARFINGLIRRDELTDVTTVTATLVNGDPGVVVESDGSVMAVAVFEPSADGTRISAIYSVHNPDKLGALG